MLVPIEPGVSQIFARLSRVARVSVANQAKSLTTGIILSPGSGLKTTTLTGSFCADAQSCDDPPYPVNTSSVYRQTATTILIPNTSTAAVDTTGSGTSVDTVLQVRNTSNLPCAKCSDDATGLGNKSLVKPLPLPATGTSRYYTLLVAASQSAAYTSPIQVYITK